MSINTKEQLKTHTYIMNIYCLDKKVEEDGTIIYKKENMLLEDYDIRGL
jgi:hypothetical protein